MKAVKTFLSTAKERTNWHHGIWKGVKYFRPSKFVNSLNAPKMDFQQWENSEGHYNDGIAVTVYSLKMTGLTAGATLLSQTTMLEQAVYLCL